MNILTFAFVLYQIIYVCTTKFPEDKEVTPEEERKHYTLTLTQFLTHDAFETVTHEVFNTLPVTITEFTKTTTTIPGNEVIHTSVDNVVVFNTEEDVSSSTTTLTDIVSKHICSTEVSTELVSVTHVEQNIVYSTATSITLLTHTYPFYFVTSIVSIDRQVITETNTVYNTVWFPEKPNKFSKNIYKLANILFQ